MRAIVVARTRSPEEMDMVTSVLWEVGMDRFSCEDTPGPDAASGYGRIA
jgi:hypothetical protein